MQEIFEAVEASRIYWWFVLFYGFYPVVTSLIWVSTAILFYVKYDLNQDEERLPDRECPFVSILIPAYFEEAGIARSLEGLTQLDYPRYEIIVINDGSTDRTVEEVLPFLENPRVRLLDKHVNEGKAMAMNDAIPLTMGELILVMDADTIPEPQILRLMAGYFRNPTVGAVCGNARVRNRTNTLTSLQAVEFSSVIGLLRRAQRVWGRIMCVSGVCGLFRREALIKAGLYSPGMATEDIDLTFKLQMLNYTVQYEPRAKVWMEVPEDIKMLWKQRIRWALGLGQALKRHRHILWTPRLYRMLPVYVESFLSVLWAWVFVAITALWIFAAFAGVWLDGGSLIPNWFGAMIGAACLLQLLTGVLIDSRYEPAILREYPFAIFYPLAYWMMMSLSSAIYSSKGFIQKLDLTKPVRWRIVRKTEG
ncbi:MAG: glycosyltransferase [Bryobacterales bacterium]|nr:glycosyltransferase [Acidobacteriota bacterium]MCB9384919.1 glycosyltransferase [Bryobacterales bacterium]